MPAKAKPRIYNKVFDRNHRRIRGLWFRDGKFFFQTRINGAVKQIELHEATTIPQALEAKQVIKTQIRNGQYNPPVPKRPTAPPEIQKVAAVVSPAKSTPSVSEPKPAPPTSVEQTTPATVSDHSIPAAIAEFRKEQTLLMKGDPKTRSREGSALNNWKRYCEFRKTKGLGIDIADVNSKLLKDFAVWRREQKLEALRLELEKGETLSENEEGISGRTLDVDVMALEKVVSWSVTEGWLASMPDLHWETLATEPAKIRLLTPKELDAFANANIVTDELLESLPIRYRHLRARQADRGQAFRDYIYLIFFTGGREYETRVQRWSQVTWSKFAEKDVDGYKAGEKIRGHIFFPGEEAKAGGGRPAEDRNVDFHDRLEEHLEEMYARRDKTTDLMFPSLHDPENPLTTFRRQLDHARKVTGQEDVGFHHGRHYFISHAVMAGVDFKTIAYWVSHRDGGVLIGKKYSHLAPGHSKKSAQKLTGAF